MSSLEKPIYRFEDVEVNLSRNSLKRGEQEQHLRRKAFQVLVYLLERRERLVTKDELIDAVWRDTAVTDDALVQCIKEIRRAVGDNSYQSRFIKTIPKSGYRFIGAVEKQNNGFHPVENISLPKDNILSPRLSLSGLLSQRKILTALFIFVAVAFSFSFLGQSSWPPEEKVSDITLPQVAGKKSLAVLYFENQSKSSELAWLREGIADMLITNLTRSSKINVLSRQQFHALLDRSGIRESDRVSFDQAIAIAQKSKATNFITGSFAQVGEKIRLDAQLYDAQTGTLLAAESLVADKPEQILTDIDLISLKLTKHLGLDDVPENQRRIADVMTDNLEAYRYYSLGVEKAQALHSREAIELLEKAVTLDPQFAMAHARIGYVLSITTSQSEKGKPHLEKSFKLSERLTEKDRLNINAWYAIANLDFPTAIQNYREIINKYPLETESYWRLGRLLAGEEQSEEAVEVLKQGLTINPEDKDIYNQLGGILSVLGRHTEAISAHQRYVWLTPSEPNAYDSLGLSYQWSGDYSSAIHNYNRALELNPNFEIALIHLANTRVWLGQYNEALNLYRRYIEIASTDNDRFRGWECIAQVYLKKRDLDLAEKAAKESLKFRNDLVWRSFVIALEKGDSARAAKLEKLVLPLKSSSERGARSKQRFELHERGYYAFRKGQVDKALEYFKEVTKRQPPAWNIETFEDNLANAYFELGRFDEAIAEYQRILQLNPNYPLVQFHLAQAFERKGLPAEAENAYKAFLQIWNRADEDIPEVVIAKNFINKS